MNTAIDLAMDEAMAMEASAVAELFDTRDRREGAEAFMEKRAARFLGF